VVTGEGLAVVELALPVILGETNIALLQAHVPVGSAGGRGAGGGAQ
jgi:hypothetical protein